MRLAEVSRADRDRLVAANAANQAFHAPWAASFTDHAGFEAWFSGLSETAVSLVASTAEGDVVAVINFSQIFRKNFLNAYVGWYGMQEFAGRGLMTAALRQAVSFAFGTLGLHRLEANIQPGNERSVALAARAGFRLEGFSPRYLRIGGVWRDHARYARLADDEG